MECRDEMKPRKTINQMGWADNLKRVAGNWTQEIQKSCYNWKILEETIS